MSLIADALKAAQQEKMRRVPAAAGSAPGGFFSVRSGPRSANGIPRPLLYALVGLGGVVVVIALVTLLLSSSKPASQVAAAPTPPLQPILNPAPAAASPFSNAAPVLTDSAASVPVATSQTATPAVPNPAATSPQRVAVQQDSGVAAIPRSIVPRDATALTARPDATGETASVLAAATKPTGTLKITMEQHPGTDIRPLFQQALAAQRLGDVAKAKELYLRALDRDPQNADLYNNLGTLYRGTGDLARAEDAYRRAITLNPKLAAAWSNLGVVLDALGRRKEAIAALQQAMEIDPSNADTKVNLALQYHAAGLYADAKRLLEEAVRTNPTMPEAQYALARTLEAMGDRNGAITHYDIFLNTSNGRFPQLERQVTQHLATLRAGS